MTNLVRPDRLTPDVLGTLRHYARKSRAGSTRRAYASQWHAFDRWCIAHDCQSLPAAPISVAAYLAQRARAKAALATLNVSLAAIVFAHRQRACRSTERTPSWPWYWQASDASTPECNAKPSLSPGH